MQIVFCYNMKHTYIKHCATIHFFYLEVATSPVLGSSVSHAPFTSPQSNVYSAVWRVGYLRSSLIFIIIMV